MFLKMVGTIARFSLLFLPVVAIATAVNCGDSGNGGTAGTSGTAGAVGSAGRGGTTGTAGTSGGTAGTGGAAVKDCTVAVATATDVNILDWTGASGTTAPAFGGYMAGTYGGGTYEYPGPAQGSPCDPTMHLCPNFDGQNWHITGRVHNYSGFGIYLTSKTDASLFTGLSFDIQGTFTATGAGDGGVAAASVTMSVTDAPHEVDTAHTADSRMTCGMCAPANGSEYDGTCATPFKVINLTATATPTVVKWLDLTGGRRPPSFTGESPNPMQLTAIAFSLPWTGTGAAEYNVDITIDNLKYTTN
jgi:hypothetical protein